MLPLYQLSYTATQLPSRLAPGRSYTLRSPCANGSWSLHSSGISKSASPAHLGSSVVDVLRSSVPTSPRRSCTAHAQSLQRQAAFPHHDRSYLHIFHRPSLPRWRRRGDSNSYACDRAWPPTRCPTIRRLLHGGGREIRTPTRRHRDPRVATECLAFRPALHGAGYETRTRVTRLATWGLASRPIPHGGAGRTRTLDLPLAGRVLSLLSNCPMEPVRGVEPPFLVYETSALPLDDTGMLSRSLRLRYSTLLWQCAHRTWWRTGDSNPYLTRF